MKGKKTIAAAAPAAPVLESDSYALSSLSVAELFALELKAMYWTENQLLLSIPVLERAAASAELKDALANHLEVTKEHVGRLEVIFEMMGERICAVKCNAMEGLDIDAENVIAQTLADSQERDLGIILSARKTEQHEAAGYKGLIALATLLGRDDVTALLQQSLMEEEQADQLLAALAPTTPMA